MDSLLRLADELPSVVPVAADVTQTAQVDALADIAFGQGRVRVLCNNAGTVGGGWSWEVAPDEWSRVMSTNLASVTNALRSFVPRLLRDKHAAHIVNTASMAGLTTLPLAAPYHCSKHAVVALSEVLYHELRILRAPIGVTALCPGFVETGLADRAEAQAGVASGTSMMFDTLRTATKAGLPPERVAEVALDAITVGRFYAFVHSGWARALARRLEDITIGREPTLVFPKPGE